MHSRLDRTLVTAALLLTSVAAWVVAGASGALANASKVMIFFIANLILTFDMIDLVARMWVTKLHGGAARGPSVDLCLPEISAAERRHTLRPYAIVVSVHDAADDIDCFIDALQPLKDAVWLIDDASQDDTLLRLRRLGWQCINGAPNRRKPGALYHLIKLLPAEIETVVVLDPDVTWGGAPATFRRTLEEVISDLQRSGAAAVSPRVTVHRHGWLAECQALEYELSCGLGRKSLGVLSTNSGISVYRRSALQDTLGRHTLSVYAEDLENSLLLLAAGERIYYDDRLCFVTEPKRTFQAWFSQRAGWSLGWAKVYWERLPQFTAIARRSLLGAYQYVFYLGISGILMLPLKLASLALLIMSLLNGIDDLLRLDVMPDHSWDDPLLFGLWYAKTAVMVAIACCVALPRGERLRHIETVPFYGIYAMLQFLPITVGFSNVLALRLAGRRIYADHYDPNLRLRLRSS
jgi:hypothetical protein